jgi:hypothetical protein
MNKAKMVAWGCAVALSAGGLTASTATGSVAAAPGGSGPGGARFDNPKQNPYFPLRPGTITRYRGSDEG